MSTTTHLDELYTQHIAPLSQADRLLLLARLAQEVAQTLAAEQPKHSIMELHGLGKEIWEGVDTQAYVNELRAEWDHRP